jgi:DNA-directed RNA polymerase specialized sigma24 family protein
MSDLHQLVQRTVAGEAAAWAALQVAVVPTVQAITRAHRGMRSKGLAAQPDDVAEVVTVTLERLARDNFQNLRRFCERSEQAGQPDSFDAWLYGTVDFVVREHLRRRFGRAPKQEAKAERPLPSKRDLQSHAGRLDDGELDRMLLSQLGMTMRLTAAQIFAHIERDFTPDEARALRMYYSEDAGFEEIAEALALADAKAAERLIRRLNARLRYRFLATEPDAQ